jgi:hypothetical protein
VDVFRHGWRVVAVSDTFWIQLFAFGGVIIVSVVAPVVVMYARVRLRLDKQFAQTKEELDSVITKVAAVHSQMEDVKRAGEMRFVDAQKFHKYVLDSGVFEPGKLKELTEKKRTSGFGELDP